MFSSVFTYRCKCRMYRYIRFVHNLLNIYIYYLLRLLISLFNVVCAVKKTPDWVTQETHGSQWTPIRAMDSTGGRGQRQSGYGLVVRVQSLWSDVSPDQRRVHAKRNLRALFEVRTIKYEYITYIFNINNNIIILCMLMRIIEMANR